MDSKTNRRGKIARLPLNIRAEVNQRLDDAQPTEIILLWLNQLAPVRNILAEQRKTGAVQVNQTSVKLEEAYPARKVVFPSAALITNTSNATRCAASQESPLGQNGPEKSKLIKANQS